MRCSAALADAFTSASPTCMQFRMCICFEIIKNSEIPSKRARISCVSGILYANDVTQMLRLLVSSPQTPAQ